MKKQFQDREVKKVYRAFVYGALKDERGIIDRPIGSARGGLGPRTATRPHGVERDARTTYHVILNGKEAAYVEAFPETGRTHQIRVHFSAIQHPIVHDALYAPSRAPILGFARWPFMPTRSLSCTLTRASQAGGDLHCGAAGRFCRSGAAIAG